MRSKWIRPALALAMVAAVAACKKGEQMGDNTAMASNQAMGMDSASYRIVFHSSWTRTSHPFEYPSSNPVSGPHFSGIIGATHNGSYQLFTDGAMPTPGIEALSEMGRHSPLDNEIRAAIAAGSAGMLFETGGLRDFSDSLVATVRVDAAHPLVSFAAMIAPSPDWFTGASVNLRENGAWVASRELQLEAWDSGGDEGATYKADDRDNNPKKPTTRAMSRHFVVNGAAVPVAHVMITRI